MSSWNFVLSWVEHENSFKTWRPGMFLITFYIVKQYHFSLQHNEWLVSPVWDSLSLVYFSQLSPLHVELFFTLWTSSLVDTWGTVDVPVVSSAISRYSGYGNNENTHPKLERKMRQCTRPPNKVPNWRLFFVFLYQNTECWYSKENWASVSGLFSRTNNWKLFSYFSIKTYVVGAQKNCLIGAQKNISIRRFSWAPKTHINTDR